MGVGWIYVNDTKREWFDPSALGDNDKWPVHRSGMALFHLLKHPEPTRWGGDAVRAVADYYDEYYKITGIEPFDAPQGGPLWAPYKNITGDVIEHVMFDYEALCVEAVKHLGHQDDDWAAPLWAVKLLRDVYTSDDEVTLALSAGTELVVWSYDLRVPGDRGIVDKSCVVPRTTDTKLLDKLREVDPTAALVCATHDDFQVSCAADKRDACAAVVAGHLRSDLTLPSGSPWSATPHPEPAEPRFVTVEVRQLPTYDRQGAVSSVRWVATCVEDRECWCGSDTSLVTALEELARATRDVRPGWVRDGYAIEVLILTQGHVLSAGSGLTLGDAIDQAAYRETVRSSGDLACPK